ncbi:AIR synthase related protein [Anaerostipes butyraticus]|uniref:AIR synthase related protein n=1 Tax=Anaerostipes butyraticus TaxID=645466 RepID=UPI0023A8DEC2|nr:AIR synthase related protein [Anaerostipes butyraticus]
MKTGRLPESILCNMAGKGMHPAGKIKELPDGFGIGKDCAALQAEDEETFVITHDLMQTIPENYMGKMAAYTAADHIAAEGGIPVGITMTALFPPDTKKHQIERVIRQIHGTCASLSMVIIEGHTEVTEAVNQPLLSVHGVGKILPQNQRPGKAKPGQELIVTGAIGLAGTGMIADLKKEELSRRFPSMFLREAEACSERLSIEKEAEILNRSDTFRMALGELGIYGALWETAEKSGTGLEVEIEKIPIKQHTIEICEYFDLNPYQLMSTGAMLIASDQGQELVRELQTNGIQAAVIGRTSDSREKLIYRQGKAANLEITRNDEFYKIK